MTGVPCPGCGLTTSFAHMAHGHLLSGFTAHLMGPMLFVMTLFVALFSPYAIVKKRPLVLLIDSKWSAPVLVTSSALGVLTWLLRVFHVLPPR